MPDNIVIQQCSPTLAGIKTGSLFTCAYESDESIDSDVEEWNKRFANKGLQIVILKYARRALVYIYRADRLAQDLTQPQARQILLSFGYNVNDVGECVRRLKLRFSTNAGFPHEVGLFLGYPPEDVEGFIRFGGRNYKCFGCWKVYGNTEVAHQCFERFKTCTACYCERYNRGCSLDDLVVAQS